MKKKSFFCILIVVVLLTVSFGSAIVGAMSSRSAMSVIGEYGLGLFMSGDSYVSPEKTDAKIEKRRERNQNYTVPSIYKNLYSVTTETINGNEVCYFGNSTDEKIIYFHGGSFMWQPLILHFSYCSLLQKNLNRQVIMPIYPKAPDNDYMAVMEWLFNFYDSVGGASTFIGDSSGAAIMLSFSQYLYDRGKEVPKNMIAISPVLDITLSNPQIADYAPLDPMLNQADLARKMATYLADGDPTDPYASPMYCDYSVLGKLTIITGTHEILYPDTKLLDEKLTALNIEHNYCVFENQNHTFAIYPITERTVVLNYLKKIL